MGAMPAITGPPAVGTFVPSKGRVHVGSSVFDHGRKLEASSLVHSGQM
jgi:hypothetical protein